MRNNSSPRGDGNLPPCRGAGRHSFETTHPREGTETELQDQDSIIHARNNSSPRGDGNANRTPSNVTCAETTHPREGTETFFDITVLIAVSKQLIPARGRKQCCDAVFFLASLETTHPREGAETRFRIRARARACTRNNSSPREDKTRLTKVRSANIIKALHPREGTENLPGDGIR